MSKSRKSEQYQAFWTAFAVEAEELHYLAFNGHFQFVYKRVKQLEGKHQTLFCTEITSKGQDLVLIFTPECNLKVAAEIDSFLTFAPVLQGWQLYGHRLPKPSEDAFAIVEQVYAVDARDARFIIDYNSDWYDVIMLTVAADKLADEDRAGFVRFSLSHLIGEDLTMKRVKNVELEMPRLGSTTQSPDELIKSIH